MQDATCTCVGLKIAGSLCPCVTRLIELFVYCNATCGPKWRSDAVPAGCAQFQPHVHFARVLLFIASFEWLAGDRFSGHSSKRNRNSMFWGFFFSRTNELSCTV